MFSEMSFNKFNIVCEKLAEQTPAHKILLPAGYSH